MGATYRFESVDRYVAGGPVFDGLQQSYALAA
jgi:hypothetical protein